MRDTDADLAADDVVASLPPLISIEETARLLGGVHPSTVKRWIRQGRIGAIRLTNGGSSRRLVPREELRRFVAAAAKAS